LAARLLARIRPVFDGLLSAEGQVDLATFWFACMPILHGELVEEAASIRTELAERWAAILGLLPGSKRLRLTVADIEGRVADAFGRREPGWAMAQYFSPDVFLTAADESSLAAGEVELILGELHLASNTMGASVFVNQHPDRTQLLDQTRQDHPQPRVLPMLAKENKARLSARVRHSLSRPDDYHVALLDFTADPKQQRTALSADVAVRLSDDRLVVVLPDGSVFGVVEVFAHVLTTLMMDQFRMLPEADHLPRVTIDRMVVARESWSIVAGEVDFARDRSEARRYVRGRRWHAELSLPRFFFVTSPAEPRPFYVDFESPIYLDIFAKAVRRLVQRDPGARLVLTEMLPTPEQAWLPDEHGNRYSCELRFVAVDAG
jgi:hypothetical protein